MDLGKPVSVKFRVWGDVRERLRNSIYAYLWFRLRRSLGDSIGSGLRDSFSENLRHTMYARSR